MINNRAHDPVRRMGQILMDARNRFPDTPPDQHSSKPQLDEQRALLVAGMVALIDSTFSSSAALVPQAESGWMIERLVRCGLASVSHGGGVDRITLMGISANCSGTSYGLLCNWQSEARNRLANGIRT